MIIHPQGRRYGGWLIACLLSVLVGLGITVTPSSAAPTPQAVSAYSGKTTVVAWQLAPGITDLASLRANPGAAQSNPRRGGAPACTTDGKTGYQVDVYKYDAANKPLVDKLVNGGVLYLAPKSPNDEAVYISGHIVVPPACEQPKPDQPPAKEFTKKVDDAQCETGVRTRTDTYKVDTEWNDEKKKWVETEPVLVKEGEWVFVRDLNPGEKRKLGCTRPGTPDPVVTTDKMPDLSCEAGVRSRTKVTTTNWVFNQKKWKWVKTEPVVTYGDWVTERPLTPAEKAQLGCERPGKPGEVKTVVASKQWNDCVSLWRQDRTATTKYVWSDEKFDFVQADSVEGFDKPVVVRKLTQQERIDYGCVAPAGATPLTPTAPTVKYPVTANTGGEGLAFMINPMMLDRVGHSFLIIGASGALLIFFAVGVNHHAAVRRTRQ